MVFPAVITGICVGGTDWPVTAYNTWRHTVTVEMVGREPRRRSYIEPTLVGCMQVLLGNRWLSIGTPSSRENLGQTYPPPEERRASR